MSQLHPRPFARRATLLTLSLAIAAPVAAPVAAQAQGVAFTIRSSTMADGAPTEPTMQRVRVRGDVMRFDGEASARTTKDGLGDGAYTLVDAANRRIQVVMPNAKQYMEIKFDDSTALAVKSAAAMTGAVSDLKVAGQSLGSGGVVNGLPTTRHRLTTDFAQLVADGERPRRMHVVEEYWVSPALRDVVDPLEQLGRTLGGRGGYATSPYAAVGGSSVNDLLSRRSAEQQRMFKGFPVKTVTTAEETAPDGSVEKTVTTTEVTDVQRGDFDAALFRVPEGYAPFDPRAFFANSMKEAAKEGVKESAKDAVKGALGGFLKRKKP